MASTASPRPPHPMARRQEGEAQNVAGPRNSTSSTSVQPASQSTGSKSGNTKQPSTDIHPAASSHRPKLTRRKSRRTQQDADAQGSTDLAHRVGAMLGVFGRAQVPQGMDSLIEYLSSWGGTDKALMLSQYSARLIVSLSAFQHRTRAWLFAGPTAYSPYGGSGTARRFAALSDACADARTLFHVWSVLPIIRWMIRIEHDPPRTRLLHNLERLQGWSLLLCLPFELIAYLGAHAIVPMGRLAHRRLSLFSARLWVAYLLLQCLHLMEENRLCRLQARALERTRGHPVPLPSLSRRSSSNNSPTEPPSPYAYYRRAEEKAPRLHGTAKKAAQRAALKPEMFEAYENDPKGAERAVTRALWDQLDDKRHDILVSPWLCIGYIPLVFGWTALPTRGPGEAPGTWRPSSLAGLVQGALGSVTALLSFRHGWRNAASNARRRQQIASAAKHSTYGYPVDEQTQSAMSRDAPALLPSDFAP